MAVVIDANLLVVLATSDDRRPAVSAQFKRWSAAGETLHAPSLIRYEVANALTGLLATGRITDERLDEAWPIITDPRVKLHDITDAPAVVRIAVKLQRRSAYDAAYIALATALGADLWTLDGPLARNAGDAGLPVRLLSTT